MWEPSCRENGSETFRAHARLAVEVGNAERLAAWDCRPGTLPVAGPSAGGHRPLRGHPLAGRGRRTGLRRLVLGRQRRHRQGHRPVGPGWLAGRGVWLLPAVGRRLGAHAGPALAVSVIVTILERGPLGPFTLTDPWPLILLAASLVLVDRGRWWPHLVAGAFVGVALNLRPASYVSVAWILLLLMVRLRRKAVPVLVGLALALARRWRSTLSWGGPSPFPMQGSLVQDVQLRYWAYVPLYATSREGADPRVCDCDRRWPSTRDSTAPTSHGDLLRFYVSHPVDSVWLGLRKVSGWCGLRACLTSGPGRHRCGRRTLCWQQSSPQVASCLCSPGR